MFKSWTARLNRLCRRSQGIHPQPCTFSTSGLVREDQPPFLKRKLFDIERDLAGEKWVSDLSESPFSRFPPKPEDEAPPEGLQTDPGAHVLQVILKQKEEAQSRDKHGLTLFREDGSVTMDPIYLRDSCQCRLCVDGSTLQRKFVTAHIPPDIDAVFQGRSNRGRVKVGWTADIPGYPADHQSIYSRDQLRSLASPSPAPAVARKRHYWNQQTFQARANWTSYADFASDSPAYKTAISALHRDGLIFITDVEATEAAVAKMAERLGPIRNTFYGPTWNVRSIPDSKNVAYTNHDLGFHMDLLYMANPPGYQLLHCLQNSCPGGESRFADAFFAATRLRHVNEAAYRLLSRHPVEWKYENDNQSYIQRRPTLHEVQHFLTTDEMTRHRLTRRENHQSTDADLAYVNWSPPFQGRMHHHPDPDPDPHQPPTATGDFITAMRAFDAILNSDEMVFELKMAEGTCAIFENRRVVHARKAFVMEGGGERWLRGAYVDEDAFWSTCRALGADRYV